MEENENNQENLKTIAFEAKSRVSGGISNFVKFIREQGVVGLAVGFILGGAVSKTVSSLVENVINPIIGILLGKVDLSDKILSIGEASINYGSFISSLIDFLIIAAVVYFIFKGLGIEQIDKKKK